MTEPTGMPGETCFACGADMEGVERPSEHECAEALARVAHLESERDRCDLLEAEKVGRLQRELERLRAAHAAAVEALEAENAELRLRLADAWYSFEPAYDEARDPNTDPDDGADWWDSMDATRSALDPKNEYRGNAALAPREAAHAAAVEALERIKAQARRDQFDLAADWVIRECDAAIALAGRGRDAE